MPRLFIISSLIVFGFFGTATAQCISAFPYLETFEANAGNWTTGGTSSDWAWGTPSKPVITGAGGGNKCWVAGGLTNSFYNNGESSWLQSPCFDFSNLQNPQVSFKVFWEVERRFDGASFQYSTDGGNNWTTLGSTNSAASCLGENWFNTTGITYLGNNQGWSGNIQPNSGSCLGGGGSNGWLTAKHTLNMLAGQPSVMFRFTFGAGTTCNNYDGFAVDDLYIGEAPPNSASFVYTCAGNNIVNFTNASSICASNFQWNFGDIASGASNTATEENPMHIFSSAGTYTVSLTVTFPNNITISSTRTITVLNANISTTNVNCFGEVSGQATVQVTGGNGNYNYTWSTVPPQTTSTASNLKAGNYTVSITAPNACSITNGVSISEPAKLRDTLFITAEKCGNNQGAITSNVTGGIQPYSFIWTNGSTASSLQNLNAGNYGVTVTDANGCTVQSTATVANITNNIALFLGNDTTICPGEKVILQAGNFNSYLWQDNSTVSSFTVSQTGKYFVRVTDNDGCSAADTITVTVDCSDVLFPTGFTPNKDGKNDLFGPLGNLGAVKNYTLKVFSRFGDVVFESRDPYKKWSGEIKGLSAASGVFAWFAEYEINGNKKMQKGTFVLIK